MAFFKSIYFTLLDRIYQIKDTFQKIDHVYFKNIKLNLQFLYV